MTTLPNPPSRFPTDRGKSAVALVASGALDNPIFVGTEHRLVPSCSKEGAFYVTSLDNCTCPDFRFRKVTCKHIAAVKIQQVLDEVGRDNQQTTESRPLTVVA